MEQASFHVLDEPYMKKLVRKNVDNHFVENVLKNDEYFTYIHMADTHNGYSGNSSRYNEYSSLRVEKTSERGINIRQDDIDQALAQAIDLSIYLGVDSVIHAGDGWDAPGYKERVVDNFYTKQITRLQKEGISYIEIAGNHNIPKKSGKGCFLESLGRYPNVHTVYQGFYEQVELEEHGVVVHCVPSTFTQDILNESLEAVEPIEGKINIGVGHFGVTNIKHYAENSEATLVTTLDKLIDCKMDYFALGDYHAPTDFGDNIRYSGPIERLGFGEVDNEPQILLVGIHKTTKEVIVKSIPLKVRPMIDLKIIDASEKNIEHINDLIHERLNSQELKDAIVRLRIIKLPKHLKDGIDTEKINELTVDCLYFKLDLKDKTDINSTTRTSNDVQFEGVLEGWGSFMEKVEDDGSFDKEKIIKLGFDRLATAYENQ